MSSHEGNLVGKGELLKYPYRLEDAGMESSLAKKDFGVLGDEKLAVTWQ